jgi:hypothetical protein
VLIVVGVVGVVGVVACFLADSNTVYDFKQLLYFNFLYSTNRKLKLKYSSNIEADKKKHTNLFAFVQKQTKNTMVRVSAEVSTVSPVSSSLSDHYKYRYGCGGSDDEHGCGCGGETIKKHLAEINERNTRISMMVEIRRNMQKLHEKQQVREINEKSEKEKQQEQCEREQEEEQRREERIIREREQEERRKKEINAKLGKIIYKTRRGAVFEAHHSIHMTVNSNYDRKTRQMVQTYTEKIIWNDRVFESKQEWFSEMNRLSAAEADVNMKIVRWD